MRRPHYSISAKILFCLAINVLALIGGAVWFFSHESGDMGFIGNAVTNARIQAFASETRAKLEERPKAEWNTLLDQLGQKHRAQLGILDSTNQLVSGSLKRFPEEMRPPLPRVDEKPPPKRPRNSLDPLPPRGGPIEGPYRLDFMKADESGDQWVSIKLQLGSDFESTGPSYLFVKAKGRESDLFFNDRTWLAAAGLAILGSIVIWAPLMLGISRRLSRVSAATDCIAEGHLATRVPEDAANDDLSNLSQSVNRMARRLEEQVGSQKRFLGDVAHELSSPIARMQAALGLLENKTPLVDSRILKKLDQQLQHMGSLVNELLLFSKASHQVQPQRDAIVLLDAVRIALSNELSRDQVADCQISDTIKILGVPALLERAIANVLRNSIRYAETDQPIELSARVEDQSVILLIRDTGPGVPEESLPKLFDAFYRPEPSRNAGSGGAGLGLAIVKSCVESCGGQVSARNREPHGLEVKFIFEKAKSERFKDLA